MTNSLASLALGVVALSSSSLCHAFTACASLDPGSPQYRSQLQRIDDEAGLNRQYSAGDEGVVRSICSNHPDAIDGFIDQGQISAHDASAIKKVLITGTKPNDRMAAANPATASPAAGRAQTSA